MTSEFHFGFPQHFLYFFPLPHGHGSFRPTFFPFRTVGGFGGSPCSRGAAFALLAAPDAVGAPNSGGAVADVAGPTAASDARRASGWSACPGGDINPKVTGPIIVAGQCVVACRPNECPGPICAIVCPFAGPITIH